MPENRVCYSSPRKCHPPPPENVTLWGTTAGGLLASVDPETADGVVADLQAAGYPDTTVIGEVLARSEWLIDCR